jgi:hypothetical protein
MERTGYIVKLTDSSIDANRANGVEVLVRQFEDGTVTADIRPTGRGTWIPVEITGGGIEKVEV